ncbi:hypothetical protein [uncultured Sphaerochaeta sp.]|uniref:hypothetical protein n=1 Tax=uncultured Sphaerochaeta sp. TaxID=886478 RepID=UPI002618A4BC|nr:hypothetical protein [uncultured Sphaerochaeta sp.]
MVPREMRYYRLVIESPLVYEDVGGRITIRDFNYGLEFVMIIRDAILNVKQGGWDAVAQFVEGDEGALHSEDADLRIVKFEKTWS